MLLIPVQIFYTIIIGWQVMARVTVEDCAEVVPSRFELVALAAQRAKFITAGGEVTVDRDNDKNAVVALREIAAKTVDIDNLREGLIKGCQEKVNVDQYGVEEMDEAAAAEGDNISDEVLDEVASMAVPAGFDSDDDDGMMYDDEVIGADD